VFGDAEALRDLEAIVHPAVHPRILRAMKRAAGRGARAVVIEAIKLVEGGLAELCDEVWLVTCTPEVQLERLLERGDPTGDARQRVAAQADIVDRLRPSATRVVDASGDPATTREMVDALLDEALRGA
jgi:dephospho-CoA kinase